MLRQDIRGDDTPFDLDVFVGLKAGTDEFDHSATFVGAAEGRDTIDFDVVRECEFEVTRIIIAICRNIQLDHLFILALFNLPDRRQTPYMGRNCIIHIWNTSRFSLRVNNSITCRREESTRIVCIFIQNLSRISSKLEVSPYENRVLPIRGHPLGGYLLEVRLIIVEHLDVVIRVLVAVD